MFLAFLVPRGSLPDAPARSKDDSVRECLVELPWDRLLCRVFEVCSHPVVSHAGGNTKDFAVFDGFERFLVIFDVVLLKTLMILQFSTISDDFW